MGSINDHRIDENGEGGGGGFSVASGTYTAKFDPNILPKDQPQYCLR